MSASAHHHRTVHRPWCPKSTAAHFDCLCGLEPRSSSAGEKRTTPPAPIPEKKNGGPPQGPPRPVNAAERSMVERGWRAGFAFGRNRTEATCPYERGSRPEWLWLAGAERGYVRGRQVLAVVQESYRRGLEQLERGQPKVW